MKKIRKSRSIIDKIVIISIVISLSLMSVGFALYNQPLGINGLISVAPDGIFEITSITLTDSVNVDVSNSEMPIITDNSIEFNLVYRKDSDENIYYAEYTVELSNNSSYDYVFHTYNFTPYVNGSAGGVGILTLNLEGIADGDTIPSKSAKTITMTLTLEVEDDSQTYEAGGTTEFETDEVAESGSILSGVAIYNNQDDLTGTSLARFTLTVTNTYSRDLVFMPIAINGSHFTVVDSNGNTPSPLTIAANAENQTYNLYLKVTDGAKFADTTDTTQIKLSVAEVGNYTSTGTLTLKVNKSEEYDDTWVSIGPVDLAMDKNTEGNATVSWTRTDNDGFSAKFGVNIYKSTDPNNPVKTYTNLTDTNLIITGLETPTSSVSYYAVVYGVDINHDGSTLLNEASTSNEYCRKSNTMAMQWRYKVTKGTMNNVTFNGNDYASITANYTATLTPATNYTLNNNNITITMNGTTLDRTSGGTTNWSYNNNNLTINTKSINITGDIVITTDAQRNQECLKEGTLITLANGTKKKIEDIDYNDLLLVWDGEHGKFTSEYPIFLENTKYGTNYQKTTFSDGTTLNTVGYHGVFSVDDMMYVEVEDREKFHIGTRILKVINNEFQVVTVTNIETIYENIKYYMLVSTTYYNIIADDVLNSTGETFLLNMYGYNNDYTFKINREEVLPKENKIITYELLSEFMDYYMYDGLRASDVELLITSGYFQEENIPELVKYFTETFSTNLKLPTSIDNHRYWMVTTSDNEVTEYNENKYLVTEGSTYELPSPKETNNFIGWYNTSDGKYYQEGEELIIWHGTNFIATYQEDSPKEQEPPLLDTDKSTIYELEIEDNESIEKNEQTESEL